MDQALQQITGLAPSTWQLPALGHLPVSWIVIGAIILGFAMGAVQIGGWVAAYFAGALGAGLLGPATAAFIERNPAGLDLLRQWPWAAVARRVLRLVGLGVVDRLAGAAVGFLASTGGLASVSWLLAQAAAAAALVRP